MCAMVAVRGMEREYVCECVCECPCTSWSGISEERVFPSTSAVR